MCIRVESVWSVLSVQFDRDGICPICQSVHPQRDRICTICMIHTSLSVGVIDVQDLCNLQDLYDLPDWNLCDLYGLYPGMGYVQSAWCAHFYPWVCMIYRICMICGISVWPGGFVKFGYSTLVCMMFSRDGSVWGGYFTGMRLIVIIEICTSLPGWICMIFRTCMIYLSGMCAIWMICTS